MPVALPTPVGEIFGYLTCIGDAPTYRQKSNKPVRRVHCRCVCGKEIIARLGALRTGNTKSCGCKHYEKTTKHKLSRHPLYKVMGDIVQRCENPKRKNFHRYGGRGITVCREWREDYTKFVEFGLAQGWKPGLTVDRRDNDGNYEPNNVRFVTNHENSKNRRATPSVVKAARENIKKAWAVGLKPVVCIDTGEVFPTVKAAAKKIGRAQNNISKAINRGGRCAGLRFQFVSNEEAK